MKKNEVFNKLNISVMVKHMVFIIQCSLVLFFISPFETMAQGGLLITPRRLVFDGKKKTEQINLANTGNDTASYVVSYVQY